MKEQTKTNMHEDAIMQRLDRIEEQVVKTQKSLAKMKKFMLWRLIVMVAVVLIPVVTLPFFINFFMKTYVSGIESLL